MATLSIITRDDKTTGEKREFLRLYYKNRSGQRKRVEILKPHRTGDLEDLNDLASEMERQRYAGAEKYSFELQEEIKYKINTLPVREIFVKANFLTAERRLDYSFEAISKRSRDILETRLKTKALTQHSFNKRWNIIKKLGEFLSLKHPEMDDMRDLGKAECIEFFNWCQTERIVSGKLKTVNSNTANQERKWITKIFNDLVDQNKFTHNPFTDISIELNEVDDRRTIIDHSILEWIEDHLEATHRNEKRGWYVYFMLTRWCGSRKNECLQLRWSDVDFDALDGMGQLWMPAPKTAKKKGSSKRRVPLMNSTNYPMVDCNLKECLVEEYKRQEPSPRDYVVQGILNLHQDRREGVIWENVNPSTTLEKKIIDAGVAPWPKLCQNLRVTRVNELRRSNWTRSEAIHAMIGHSEEAFQRNYSEVTDEDYLSKFTPLAFDKWIYDKKLRLRYSPQYSPTFTTTGRAYAERTISNRPEEA